MCTHNPIGVSHHSPACLPPSDRSLCQDLSAELPQPCCPATGRWDPEWSPRPLSRGNPPPMVQLPPWAGWTPTASPQLQWRHQGLRVLHRAAQPDRTPWGGSGHVPPECMYCGHIIPCMHVQVGLNNRSVCLCICVIEFFAVPQQMWPSWGLSSTQSSEMKPFWASSSS